MERERTRIAKSILKRKNKMGRLTLPISSVKNHVER